MNVSSAQSTSGDNGSMATDPLFESGVVRMQEGKEDELTRNERRVASPLLRYLGNSDAANDIIQSGSCMTMAPQLAKRRKTCSLKSNMSIARSFSDL